MTAQAHPSAPHQEYWIADSGSTNYMSADLSYLFVATPFTHTEQIATENGVGLHGKHYRCILDDFSWAPFGSWEMRLGDGKSITFPYLVSQSMRNGFLAHEKARGNVYVAI
ncbi:hypothetical protein L3X38_027071 [Prunus dulcis]|uniref:Uncharacterized protein n=1 Tax=Prunus dulcis TaxID=3755 RepID=A0AAD4VM54_PRUDU|nr:hypothetical protein L3X38_027071 [Prunus dulcis]